jgi:hypothetical protein
MSLIPVSLTEEDFEKYVRPHLETAKRGYECKIALFKVVNYILDKLHRGCQWYRLAIKLNVEGKQEISHHGVYYHFRKWSRDGSLKRVFEASILSIMDKLDLSEVNLDGSHSVAKKGGESVAYQARKKAKITNIVPFTDAKAYFIISRSY